MSRSKSSKRWLAEHFTDQFVKQAKAQGFRSRAAFKLLALQEKDKIISSGMTVIDLGAAPGSWSQLISQWVGPKGQTIALDILPMDPLPHVNFIQGDFTEPQVIETLIQMSPKQVDVIVSDMAPNMTGIEVVDQARVMYLAEIALDTAIQLLKPEGHFLVKTFQGSGFDDYLRQLKKLFTKVLVRKPAASRTRSSEIYLVAKGFKSKTND